jgi:malonate transporter
MGMDAMRGVGAGGLDKNGADPLASRAMHALFDIVLPVFGIILLGFLSGRFRVLGGASSEALNRFVYYFALPPLLFLSTARAPVAQVLNWPFIAASLLGAALTLVVALPGSRWLFGVRDPASLGLHGLAAVFANTGYMGIPLFVAAFGRDGALLAVVTNMFLTVVALGTAILLFELVTKSPEARGSIVGDLARTLGYNPILLAPFLGLLLAALGVELPVPLVRLLELLGAAAAPAALFAIGLSLAGRRLSGELAEVGWLTLMKLVVHPLVTWLLVTYLFRLDPFWARSAVLLAALPVGALVFVVSQQFNVRVATGSAAIVVTTVLSVVTLSVLLIWMGVN